MRFTVCHEYNYGEYWLTLVRISRDLIKEQVKKKEERRDSIRKDKTRQRKKKNGE